MRFGPYELDTCLGRGGMGEVHGAVHVPSGTPVALKLVRRGSSAAEEEFLHEARAAAGLQHPHIVQVLDLGRLDEAAPGWEAGTPYLVMERAAGSLSSHVGKLSWSALRRTLLALLDALAHAHAHGVVHCDLKPGNVLVGGQRSGPRLADFGLARALRFGVLAEGGISGGTAAYMAPEQAARRVRDLGPWTDLYALGALGWTLATGEPLFRGSSVREIVSNHLSTEPGAFVPRHPVPEGFEPWLRLLLEKSTSDRFTRAADAAYVLASLPEAHGRVPTVPGVDRSDETFVFELAGTTVGMPPGAVSPAGVPVQADPPPVPRRWPVRPPPRLPPELVGLGLGLFGLRRVPLVDREPERAALWDALLEAQARRRPQAVVLRGPAGTGKSRLADELCAVSHEVGATNPVKVVHGPELGPDDGIEPMLRRALRCDGLEGQALVDALDLAMHMRGVTSEVEQLLLRRMLGPRDGPLGISERLRHAVALSVLRKLAVERPVVLWVDDAQWGVDALQLVHRLLDADDLPVLVVLTLRDDALDPSAARALETVEASPQCRSLVLGPLPPQDRRELVDLLLGLEPGLAEEVVERSGGHPLFLVQLLGGWAEQGVLRRGPKGLRLSGASLPADEVEAWTGRLERALQRMPPGGEWAVERAAVLGTERLGRAWERAVADCCDASAVVRVLLDAGLATWDRHAASWSFVHGALRSVLLARARTAGRLQAHHRRCAEVLAALGDPSGAGRHLLRAGDPAAAIDPLLEGARLARKDLRYERAEWLQDALIQALDAAGMPPDDVRRGEWMRERLYVLRRDSSRDDELAASWELAEAARRHGWAELESVGLRRAANALRDMGRASDALAPAREALRLSTDAGLAEERVWALHRLASTLTMLGRGDEALPIAEQASEEARALGEDHSGGICDVLLSSIHLRAGRLQPARILARQAVDRLDAVQLRGARADALAQLGDALRGLGEHDEAARAYREASALFSISDPIPAAVMLVPCGVASQERGAFAEALEIYEECGRTIGDAYPPLTACIDVYTATCLAGVGRWDEAEATLDRAIAALVDNAEADPDIGHSGAQLAGLAAADGRPALARRAAALGASHLARLGRVEEAAALRALYR